MAITVQLGAIYKKNMHIAQIKIDYPNFPFYIYICEILYPKIGIYPRINFKNLDNDKTDYDWLFLNKFEKVYSFFRGPSIKSIPVIYVKEQTFTVRKVHLHHFKHPDILLEPIEPVQKEELNAFTSNNPM